ncbi:MAG: VOC family protein [Anaerolineaceae bacterium]
MSLTENGINIKIGVVHLNVTQLDRAQFFFEEGLGFKEIKKNESEVILGNLDKQPLIALHKVNNPTPRKRTTGLYHIAILLPSREDLARLIYHMVNNQINIEGTADHGVSESFYLTGPEETGIELYCDRPMEDWPIDDEGQLDMGTDPLDIDDLMYALQGKNKQWNGLPSGTRIGHIHLRAAELEKTSDFYSLIGLEVTQDYGESALFFAGGEYHHHIALNTWQSAGAEPLPEDTAGLRFFEILVENPEILKEIKGTLETQEINFEGNDQGISVTDPNGIHILIRKE